VTVRASHLPRRGRLEVCAGETEADADFGKDCAIVGDQLAGAHAVPVALPVGDGHLYLRVRGLWSGLDMVRSIAIDFEAADSFTKITFG
jgi:hypothetical protein